MLSKKTKLVLQAMERIHIKDKADYLSIKRDKPFKIPKFLYKDFHIDEWQVKESRIVSLEPKNLKVSKEIIFYHGGAYAEGVKVFHFALMAELAKALKGRITLVDYPLAPEHHAPEILDLCLEAYYQCLDKSQLDEVILIGDSAGGGIALAISMTIRDEIKKAMDHGVKLDAKVRMPDKTILYSPWLDISMSHPEMIEYDKKDLILNIQALKAIGKVYSDTYDLKDYRVSPIFGDLNNLGDVAIFYGTDENFYPDCRDFCDTPNLVNTSITGFVYPFMQHDWLVIPIEERDEAIRETADFVLDLDINNR